MVLARIKLFHQTPKSPVACIADFGTLFTAKLILHQIERRSTQNSHLLNRIAQTHLSVMKHEDLLEGPENDRMFALCRLSSIHLGNSQAQQLIYSVVDEPSAFPAEPHELLTATAFLGEMKFLKALLQAGADVNGESNSFGTPLKAAVIQGNLDIAKLLIQLGADVNRVSGYDGYCDKYRGSALLACAKRGYFAMVRLLLEPSFGLATSGQDFENALICSTRASHVEVVRLLLEKSTFPYPLEIRKEIMLLAALMGCLSMVEMMLDQGVNANAEGSCRDRALELAAREGHASVVSLLLDRGANLDYQGGHYDAITGATYSGNIDLVHLLLDRGADINSDRWKSPSINIATRYNYPEILEFLIDRGADLDFHDCGTSALSRAVSDGNQQIVKILLKAGIDVKNPSKYAEQLICRAKADGHNGIVQLLLEYGAKNV